MENQHNNDDERQPKTLLEEANGNFLLAFTMYVDRLPLPTAVRTIVKSVFLGFVVAVALAALLWPWLTR